MKKFFFLLGSLFSIHLSAAQEAVDLSQKTIVYQLDKSRYAVIFINEDRVPQTRAKKKAVQRAALLGSDLGYSYFSLDDTQKVMVVKSDAVDQMPGNLYQELIVEDDFSPSLSNQKISTGYKIIVTFYKEKPGKRAIRVCSVVKCS